MRVVDSRPNERPEPRGELASRILAMPANTNPMRQIALVLLDDRRIELGRIFSAPQSNKIL